MSIIRVKHDKNNPYVVVNKSILSNNKISAEAKTIYFYAFSRPDDWDFNRNDICNQMKEGRDQVKRALKELEDFGYLKKEACWSKERKCLDGWDWVFYESPQEDSNKDAERLKTSQTENQSEVLYNDITNIEEEEEIPEKPLSQEDEEFYESMCAEKLFSFIPDDDKYDLIQKYGYKILNKVINDLFTKHTSFQKGKVPAKITSPVGLIYSECAKSRRSR